MKLNCDLGESFGNWTMGMDESVMPHIDWANVACGFHAGDPSVMRKTLILAQKHNVEVGAHPGYLDLQGFGRRHIQYSEQEIIDMVIYQVSALVGMAATLNVNVQYVKPHGAMYNDMMRDKNIRCAIYQALSALKNAGMALKLMMLATKENHTYTNEAKEYGIELLFEVFADRRYTDEGKLQARTETGSVLAKDEVLMQVNQLISGNVVTASGNVLEVKADTICVHGDNLEAIALVEQIHQLCAQ